MVRIGIIGIGFMGVTHYQAVKEIKDAQVTAICTRNPDKLKGDWRTVRGNFGPAGGQEDLTGVNPYRQLDDLIADPAVDLVDICLPTDLHCQVAVKALQTGKHVLVEKPIALTLKDADTMIEAAQKAGKTLMVGQVLRFFPEFAYVKQVVESGTYGKLLAAHFKRVIARPDWASDDWFNNPTRTGGPVIDLHIHDADFVHYLSGLPKAVFATGITDSRGQVTYLTSQYLYPDQNLSISVESGAIAMSGLLFEHGYDVFLEGATVQFDSNWGQPVTLYTADGEKTNPELSTQDGFVREIGYAVRCLEKGKIPHVLSGENGRNALLLCLKAREAVLAGKTVTVS